jgi:energy-coupling factor transporter ATP-binding protein EcfA2
MLTVDEVVNALAISRQQFAIVFLQAQYDKGDIPGEERMGFDAIGLHPDPKQSFKNALEYASKKGFFTLFVKLLINRGYDNGTLLKLLHDKNPNNSELQAIMNATAGFSNPAIAAANIPKAMRWTGKVQIDGQFQGSGVLIGPKRFLTAWHVVQSMFQLVNAGGQFRYEPKAAPPMLEVVFDDFNNIVDDQLKPGEKITVAAESDWHETHSVCHEEELNGNVNEPYAKLDGFWDYAIIRLQDIPGNDRRFTPLKKYAVVPPGNAKITVFQHPAAAPLLYDTDKILDLVELAPPGDPDIPRLRFLHAANAAPGSSGGPVFDKEFSLVGLHQGTWTIQNKKINIGIPILNIIQHLESQKKGISSAEVLEQYFICSIETDDYAPVIGCDDFQRLVMEMEVTQKPAGQENLSLRKDAPRLLLISGTKGCGKTYLTTVMNALLDNAEHLKIELKGEAIAKEDALSLAKRICSIAGSELKDVIPVGDYHSTPAAWVKDELCKKMMDCLEATHKDRAVWIYITDLNKFEIQGAYAADLLFHMYGYVLTVPWLRIILDGASIEMPKTLNPVMTIYVMSEIKQQHVTDYVTRFLRQLKLVRAKAEINAYASMLFMFYTTAYNTNKETAIAELAKEAQNFFNQLIDQIKNN